MFTGLVVERGRLVADPVPSGQGGVRLAIGHSAAVAERLSTGASLAVSGVCLTVTDLAPDASCPWRSIVEVSPETLSRTTLGELRAGDEVNLEPPLRMGDPLGGHWVQGHVDTTVAVVEPLGMSTQVTLEGAGERVTLLTLERPRLVPGDGLIITARTEDIHVFDRESGLRLN